MLRAGDVAGLVLMGACAHSRFREQVFGGATCDYLPDFSVLVLMAHCWRRLGHVLRALGSG